MVGDNKKKVGFFLLPLFAEIYRVLVGSVVGKE